jgi:hypothetical protein
MEPVGVGQLFVQRRHRARNCDHQGVMQRLTVIDVYFRKFLEGGWCLFSTCVHEPMRSLTFRMGKEITS